MSHQAASRVASSTRPPSLRAHWLGVHAPDLSLEAFAASLGPLALCTPLGLVAQHRITAVSPLAAELGVQVGMKRATALALAPALVLGQADAQREEAALMSLAQGLMSLTPSVCWQPPHTVLAEVQASLRYFGGADRLWQQAQSALQPLGHRLQWAEAPTALAAAWLAQVPAASPPRLCRQLPQPWTDWLDALPVAVLDLPPPFGERCQTLGLTDLGALRALPPAGMSQRLGPACGPRLRQAYGEAPDPRQWLRLPAQFQAMLELPCRTHHVETLLAAAAGLLQRLAVWARAHRARVQQFELVLQHETRLRATAQGAAGPQHSRLPFALAQPSADPEHWLGVLRERLAREPLTAEVIGMGVACSQPVACEAPTEALFPELAGPDQEGLMRLLDRLEARLGPGAVHTLALVPEHRPERSVAPRPIQTFRPADTVEAMPARITRPLWLLPEPQSLPERQGRPWWNGQALRLLEGPERIESGWWDGGLVCRDYFIAGLPDGRLCWLFRPRLPGLQQQAPGTGWFIQGWFA